MSKEERPSYLQEVTSQPSDTPPSNKNAGLQLCDENEQVFAFSLTAETGKGVSLPYHFVKYVDFKGNLVTIVSDGISATIKGKNLVEIVEAFQTHSIWSIRIGRSPHSQAEIEDISFQYRDDRRKKTPSAAADDS